MFHQEYRGGAVSDFITALSIYRRIYDPNVYFGRSISILQSSGTGKSRFVKELGNIVDICFTVLLPQPDQSMSLDTNLKYLLSGKRIPHRWLASQ
jgi:hypothetical protein